MLYAEDKVYEPDILFQNLKAGEKGAIVLVHFGTTHDDTRAATLDVLNDLVKEAFPNVEVREAYTSRIIMKRLRERGIVKISPQEVLQKLKGEGFTHILVQPTQIINGVEMESLKRDIKPLEQEFEEVRVSTQLLDSPEDYKALAAILTKNKPSDRAYLWIGHGTYDVSTAQYCMLDYIFGAEGHHEHIVATIEGYPGMEEALARLKALGRKSVTLSPLLIVSGEHAKNDVAVDAKERLEKEGYDVTVDLRGLGEYPEVRELFLEKIKFASTHRKLDIMWKKGLYEKTGEKLTTPEE